MPITFDTVYRNQQKVRFGQLVPKSSEWCIIWLVYPRFEYCHCTYDVISYHLVPKLACFKEQDTGYHPSELSVWNFTEGGVKHPLPPFVQRERKPSANWVNPQLTTVFSVAIWLFTVMDRKITCIVKNQIKKLPSWFWIASFIKNQQHTYFLKLGSPLRVWFVIISVNQEKITRRVNLQ